jgi:signal transduction histidine kinase
MARPSTKKHRTKPSAPNEPFKLTHPPSGGKKSRRGTKKRDDVFFSVSAGLQRIIGRDLITNEFVAIFELVKNSFDAHARRVDLLFEDDNLIVSDDGKGMSSEDIRKKWLFVAYSAKRDDTEDTHDYREQIDANKKPYAGSKGVGRFSCDRLGTRLNMQTRTDATGAKVEVVEVDWERFELNSRRRFETIPVQHTHTSSFDIPAQLPQITRGTILKIIGLRESWDREKLLKLRAALTKLINPFGSLADNFQIHLSVPEQKKQDTDVMARGNRAKRKSPEDLAQRVVNGQVRNFIFETLKEKTTHLETTVSEDGLFIESQLIDRGARIYKIREPNPYDLLKQSGFACNLFYLNRSAKKTFTGRMGISPVKFGSVFLFRHGFRVFPVGEEADDTFGIDRRKQQGYARFLGTRDIIGRLDIAGEEARFRESSSRDKGLVKTPAYAELVKCFLDHCLKRLERYIVSVSWEIKDDADATDTSFLRGDKSSARITAIVAKLAGTTGVELLDFNHDLIRILDERADDFKETLDSLRLLAEKEGNAKLLRTISAASNRYSELQRTEAAARETADKEREARIAAERKASEAEKEAQKAQTKYAEEHKRNLFLTSLTSLDRDTIEILLHQIVIHASAVNETAKSTVNRVRRKAALPPEALLSAFEAILFQNRKILSTARFATKANFRLESESIEENLADYMVEYIEKVAPMFSDTGIQATATSLVKTSAKIPSRKFKPIEVAILVDNMISNAGKAGAETISFTIEQSSKTDLKIVVQDDGRGIDPAVEDLQRLFEKGFTSTDGSGLGLFHVTQILDDLGGTITAERTPIGAKFNIRIKGR